MSRVKLLFDENLSPRLPRLLADAFLDSTHVHQCGLGTADDRPIWNFAAQNGFVIVSKDVDFCDLSLLLGSPPKIIWLRVGNCPTCDVVRLLRQFRPAVKRFGSNPHDALLILP